MVDKNVIPEGVIVGDKPVDIDSYTSRRGSQTGKWNRVAQTLPLLDHRKTVQIDIKGVPQKSIYYIKKAIRDAAKKRKIVQEVRFAIMDSILHVWINA